MGSSTAVPSDLEISRSVTPRPILDVVHELGLRDDEVELYGNAKAKVTLSGIERLEREQARGKYVVVTGTNPTPLGEGKSTTTVGLAQALQRLGLRASVAIRQPRLGPVFGIKGGAAGGGYSQVVPMEDFNLHLTGDMHAVGVAHNLLAAIIDNHLYHGNQLEIDPARSCGRACSTSATAPCARSSSAWAATRTAIRARPASTSPSRPRSWPSSPSRPDLTDLRARLGRIVVAMPTRRRPVTAEDLGRRRDGGAPEGRDQAQPLQTLEDTPAFVHSGPFGNIAHGNSVVLADRDRPAAADIVVTEAASAPTWASRSSSTSSAAPPACAPTRP